MRIEPQEERDRANKELNERLDRFRAKARDQIENRALLTVMIVDLMDEAWTQGYLQRYREEQEEAAEVHGD